MCVYKIPSPQEQLEHAEVSTALRYLGQYYFKNKLYDEASLCAQRCCDYNDVSAPAWSRTINTVLIVIVIWDYILSKKYVMDIIYLNFSP